MAAPLTLRAARPDELEPLLALQLRSLRALSAGAYAPEVIEAALAEMLTMDPRLIGDGTLLVAEAEGQLAGCIGWTLRPPIYARLVQQSLPAPPPGTATLRSLYVEPVTAQRGVGRALLQAAEARVRQAGLAQAEIIVALSAVPFCVAQGYHEVSRHALRFAGGIEFPIIRLRRRLDGGVLNPDSPAAPGPASA